MQFRCDQFNDQVNGLLRDRPNALRFCNDSIFFYLTSRSKFTIIISESGREERNLLLQITGSYQIQTIGEVKDTNDEKTQSIPSSGLISFRSYKGEKNIMKLKLFIIIAIILVISLFGTVIALAKTELARLEIINRSDQPVSVSLIGEEIGYFLTVSPGKTQVFTVDRDNYSRTTFSCGLVDSGSVNIKKNMRLVFTNCYGNAPNWGEPRQEKVHIDDAPDGINWLYK